MEEEVYTLLMRGCHYRSIIEWVGAVKVICAEPINLIL
jgi:hypothetical protein